MNNSNNKNIMTYNKDGDGVINGKTVRQLEAEAMASPEFKKKFLNDKKLDKELIKIVITGIIQTLWIKAKKFFNNNYEIIIGTVIAILFILTYYYFKTDDKSGNGSLLGGMIGGLGAIFSILLSINFSRKCNDKTLESTVLPHFIVKKFDPNNEDFEAYKYGNDFWIPFDFNTIKDDIIAKKRNGIAYLHIENIGIGPAKNIKFKINNFGSIFLHDDFLKVGESKNIILNFNDPPKSSDDSTLILEYESIRNQKHIQKFRANITWHLDRTNFTLFGDIE